VTGKGKDKHRQMTEEFAGEGDQFHTPFRRRSKVRGEVMFNDDDTKIHHSNQGHHAGIL
jgi:hypothetical protein